MAADRSFLVVGIFFKKRNLIKKQQQWSISYSMQEGLDHPARRACPTFVFLSEKEGSAMNRPL